MSSSMWKVVKHVEVDGPLPGQNSMLSFASVAVHEDGRIGDRFDAVLSPLPDARPGSGHDGMDQIPTRVVARPHRRATTGCHGDRGLRSRGARA